MASPLGWQCDDGNDYIGIEIIGDGLYNGVDGCSGYIKTYDYGSGVYIVDTTAAHCQIYKGFNCAGGSTTSPSDCNEVCGDGIDWET